MEMKIRAGENCIDAEVIRSNRKTIAVEVRRDASVIIRAPFRASERELYRFMREHAGWIERKVREAKLRAEKAEETGRLSPEEIDRLADLAVKKIPERVAYYAPKVGVSYGRITIRNQKTLWGSCSAKGNLNFNCLLMLMPPEILDYVVVHELCHRLEMNHSPAFWAKVEEVLPDYRQRRKWLKEHGNEYMLKMHGAP